MRNEIKYVMPFFVLAIIFGCASNNSNLPPGTIQKGSLSNQQLIKDAMVGVSQKMVVLGCNKPESYEPYIISMPQGHVGSRFWKELWVVKGCNSHYSIHITFSEDGPYAANYTVE